MVSLFTGRYILANYETVPPGGRVLAERFRDAGYLTGDNEPYSGKAPADYTVDNHGEANGLPCVGIEIRQDLVGDAAGIDRIAAVMHDIVASIPERLGYTGQKITA